MTKKSDAPAIRFKGFSDAWEQRKFDEVFDCTVPNNTLSRAELSYDEGTVLNVHYGDVLIKYGSVLDVQKDDIPRIPHRCREDFNGALLQDGDVIIADTAEDETTGKACEIGNLQGSAIVSGLHTMVCRPRNRMALGYLGYYLNSNAYHHQLLPLMQGIKVLSLSRSNIQKTSVSYPIAVKEQQLIAYYFSQLDNLITLHQRKFEKLTNVKKSMLEKMFPQNGSSYPEIRFKGFTDPWEQRKLTEFVESFSGLTYTPNDVQENGTLVLRSSNVSNGEVVDADNVYVNPQVVNSENVKVGDIVVVVRNGSRSLIGKHAQIKAFMPNTVIGAFMTGIRSECPEFTNALLNTSRFEEEIAMNMGATINQITGYMFSKMEFKVPCLDEQKKIGEYFEKLDRLVTLHQRELEKLQNIKKSMLEKMFV